MKNAAVAAVATAMIPKGIPTASPTTRPILDALEGGGLDCSSGVERLEDDVIAASVCDVNAGVVMVRPALVEAGAIVPSNPDLSSTPTTAPGMKLKTFSLSLQHDASVTAQQ